METIKKSGYDITGQLKRHSVALISLAIAVTSLFYNGWRNETSESQRNIRHAAFRVLEELGDLQQIVNFRYYANDLDRGNRFEGWGKVAMVRDLCSLISRPCSRSSDQLFSTWEQGFDLLIESGQDQRRSERAADMELSISKAIGDTRAAVLAGLTELH